MLTVLFHTSFLDKPITKAIKTCLFCDLSIVWEYAIYACGFYTNLPSTCVLVFNIYRLLAMVPGFRLTILMKIIKISYLGQKVDKISNGLSKIKAISGGIRVDTDRGG